MPNPSKLKTGNVQLLRKTLDRVLSRGEIREGNLLDRLLADRLTWHYGGMSDPFQPAESTHHVTRDSVSASAEHGISILFSTKSDTLRGVELDPALHSIQMSVSSANGSRSLEPNVPDTLSRVKFYNSLKDSGFRVGIRIQPFIPGISDKEILDVYDSPDYVTIEGIKLVPQNAHMVDEVLRSTGLSKSDFTQMGLLNLKPEIRREAYAEVIERLESDGTPYSIADNDAHHITKSRCCCGDVMAPRNTGFNSTALSFELGSNYSVEDVSNRLGAVGGCVAKSLFTSNRQEGCSTVSDFYDKRFDRKGSPFSPKFLNREIF